VVRCLPELTNTVNLEKEHKCKELPPDILYFLDIFTKRWRRIDHTDMSWKWVNYCGYCGVELQSS
jgi:hypothetical protein